MQRLGDISALAALAIAAIIVLLWFQTIATEQVDIRVGETGDGVWLKSPMGWSNREQTSALPVASGTISSSYRWTSARTTVNITPATPGVLYSVAIDAVTQGQGLEPSQIMVSAGDMLLVSSVLPHPDTLRTIHLLVPAAPFRDELRLGLATRNPQKAEGENRMLGFLVTRISAVAMESRLDRLFANMRWPWLPIAILLPAGLLIAAACSWPIRVIGILVLCGLALSSTHPTGTQLLRWWCPVVVVWAVGTIVSRRTKLNAPAILSGVLILLGIVFFTPFIAGDGVGYYAYLRSLVMDYDLDFANEFGGRSLRYLLAVQTATGLYPNQWSVGPAIVWSPGYLVAHLMVSGCNLFPDCPWELTGYSLPYTMLSMVISFLSGVAAAILACRLSVVTFGIRARTAVLSTLGIVIGSSWLHYMTRNPSYAHAVSAGAMALFAMNWWGSRQRNIWFWVRVGLLGGLLTIIYWINLLLMVWPALALAEAIWRDWRGSKRMTTIRHGLVAALTGLLAVLPQLLVWRILYGSWLPNRYGEDPTFEGIAVHLWTALTSNGHGILVWTPLVGLAVLASPFAVLLAPRNIRREAAYMVIGIMLFLVYFTSITIWNGGTAFGLRRMVNVAPLLIPLLGLVLERLGRWWDALPSLVVFSGAAWTFTLFLESERSLITQEPGDLISLSFREVFASSVTRLSFSAPGQPVTGYVAGDIMRGTTFQAVVAVLAALMMIAACWGVHRAVWSRR